MKHYGDLDLKKIMDAEGLDFAHYTYGKGQCTCCYGPLEMPAKYWRNGKKPRRHFLSEDKKIWDYYLNGEKYNEDNAKYILFKNAHNCGGTVTAEDIIGPRDYIEYVLEDLAQVHRVCQLLREQLDDDYAVIEPKSLSSCIIIEMTPEARRKLKERT